MLLDYTPVHSSTLSSLAYLVSNWNLGILSEPASQTCSQHFPLMQTHISCICCASHSYLGRLHGMGWMYSTHSYCNCNTAWPWHQWALPPECFTHILQPLYGFGGKDPARFARAAGHQDLLYVHDPELTFEQVCVLACLH